MTQKEKIVLLKDTIVILYEKEGRSKKYISDLLLIDRKILSDLISEWGLIKADVKHLTPSNEKFLNKNRKRIIDMLDSDVTMTNIAKTLNISRKSLLEVFIKKDKELLHHYNLYLKRKENRKNERIKGLMDNSSREYIEDLPGEEWKVILGYENYQISNLGRVRKLAERYNSFYLIKSLFNSQSGREYVTLCNDKKRANLNVARLVAFAFVPGYSKEKNTVNHKDGDVTNNAAANLEWVSQSENNALAYKNGRCINMPYSKREKFKKIILDNKYEFKSILALSRFLNVSETQVHRYIDGESKTNHTFEFIY